MRTPPVTRRSFLQRCTAAAALSGLPLWFVEHRLAAAEAGSAKRPAANDRPGVALIGCGGQGTRDAQNAAHWGEVRAVCDVDRTRAAAAAEKLKDGDRRPEILGDFRRLLERDDIHVLVNGTPDHWHTLVNLGAARAKKDVYAEKPLTLTIDEGRRLVAAVRARGSVLQTGTQQRSSQRFRLACELVRNGRIGRLREAKVWLPAGLREGPFAPPRCRPVSIGTTGRGRRRRPTT
jgi:predicted dehydrogenase